MTLGTITPAQPFSPHVWVTVEDMKAAASVDSLLQRFFASLTSPSPSLSPSPPPSPLFSSSLSPLRVCASILVSSLSPSRSWSPLQLSSALQALFSLHRVGHCPSYTVRGKGGEGMLEGPLPSYRTCRLYFLHQLLALSCPCPPFSSPVLDNADCAALVSLLNSDYFPFLSLSQWTVRRTTQLHLHPTTHCTQQPTLLTQALQPLDSAAAEEREEDEEGQVENEERGEDEEVREETGDSAGSDVNSDPASSAAADPPVSGSPAVKEAVAQLRVQFEERLNAIERGRVGVQ